MKACFSGAEAPLVKRRIVCGTDFSLNSAPAVEAAAALAKRLEKHLVLVHAARAEGVVLEVGPGMGMLTKHLLAHSEYQTYAVEADRDMVQIRRDDGTTGTVPLLAVDVRAPALVPYRTTLSVATSVRQRTVTPVAVPSCR